MPTYRVKAKIDGLPTFERPLQAIWDDLEVGGALKTLTPLEFITDGQRRWWKGVLLRNLASDSGDSMAFWESVLKLQVMPDHFEPQILVVGTHELKMIPSITTLGKKKMSELIEGSVQYLRGPEHDKQWVTLPDEALRK